MNTQAITALIDTPVGKLAITADHVGVKRIHFQRFKIAPDIDTKLSYVNQVSAQAGRSAVLKISEQIIAYFKRAHANWPVAPIAGIGSEFQRKVWRYLATIPLAETYTYSEIANALASHQRPIAAACKANPFIIMLPCHRVISANGMGGYAGYVKGEAIKAKKWLLNHERQ